MTNLGVATALTNAARELTARAEAAEARVAKQEGALEQLRMRLETAQAERGDARNEANLFKVLARDFEIERAEYADKLIAAEARVAELSKRGTRVGEKELGERCDRLERERDEARAKLAAADRLAEAARAAIRALDYGDEETKLEEALAAYEAGEPVDSAREAESDE